MLPPKVKEALVRLIPPIASSKWEESPVAPANASFELTQLPSLPKSTAPTATQEDEVTQEGPEGEDLVGLSARLHKTRAKRLKPAHAAKSYRNTAKNKRTSSRARSGKVIDENVD